MIHLPCTSMTFRSMNQVNITSNNHHNNNHHPVRVAEWSYITRKQRAPLYVPLQPILKNKKKEKRAIVIFIIIIINFYTQ